MDSAVPTSFERDWEAPVTGDPLRIAVVGLGWFGRDVAVPAIAASDYCMLGAAVSGSPEKAERVATDHDAVPLTYEEFQAGEASDAYDAVYVVTPNALHLPYVEAAAAQGKAVLCEKPLEATADRAESLVATCDDAGVPLMTAYRMQTTRSVRWAREQIRGGRIGEPVQFNGEFSFRILAGGGDPTQWRLDKDLAGGGALMDIGVYPLNTARFVLDRDPVSVDGRWYATRDPFEGVDEHVMFQLGFPDAISATCSASFGAKGVSRFAVLGTEGRIVFRNVFGADDDREIRLEVDGAVASVQPDEPNEMIEEFDYFATKVLREEPIRPDGRHGLLDVRVTEGVYESGRTGQRIEL